MDKIDLKRDLPEYFNASPSRFSVVTLPKCNYLMVDGQGDPNASAEYAEAIEILYGVAYTLKFVSKNELGHDFVVAPLEGLWWADDMASFATSEKSKWQWTAMIMLPSTIVEPQVTEALTALRGKKPDVVTSRLRFDSLTEGLCVQILYVGPYDREGPVLATMHNEFMPQHGYVPSGRHHEIYLGDPRRTAPDRLRTILRQPVTRR